MESIPPPNICPPVFNKSNQERRDKKEEEERKGNELSEFKSNYPYYITIMLNPHR